MFGKDRKRLSGILLTYGTMMVAAISILQKCVTFSLPKAEYVLLIKVVKAVVLLRNVLTDLRVEQMSPPIFRDNEGLIEWPNFKATRPFNKFRYTAITRSYVISI